MDALTKQQYIQFTIVQYRTVLYCTQLNKFKYKVKTQYNTKPIYENNIVV